MFPAESLHPRFFVALFFLAVLHFPRNLLVIEQVIFDGCKLCLRILDSFAEIIEVLGLLLDVDNVFNSLLDALSVEALLLDVLNRHQNLSQLSDFVLFVLVVNLGLFS